VPQIGRPAERQGTVASNAMARLAVSSYMVRYPLGGNLSWALQWIIGLQRLGHDVWIVEEMDAD
jgi:hypothetical protein